MTTPGPDDQEGYRGFPEEAERLDKERDAAIPDRIAVQPKEGRSHFKSYLSHLTAADSFDALKNERRQLINFKITNTI